MLARLEFQSGSNAFVDETVMLQFKAGIGVRPRIGEQDLRMVGKPLRIPGESRAFSLLNPRIYVPFAHFNQV